MKNKEKKEKQLSLDKNLFVWYIIYTDRYFFSIVFISFDETPVTQLPCLGSPQNRVNSNFSERRFRVVSPPLAQIGQNVFAQFSPLVFGSFLHLPPPLFVVPILSFSPLAVYPLCKKVTRTLGTVCPFLENHAADKESYQHRRLDSISFIL
jgi:hypothetical protein